MKLNRAIRSLLLVVVFAAGEILGPTAARAQDEQASTQAESVYYELVTIPTPEDVVLEVGGLELLPDGSLAVSTRRGEIWRVEDPYKAEGQQPYFTRYAQGLHEPLGLVYKDDALYTAQRGKLTRLEDKNGDGRADSYNVVYSWPLSGNYHEYSFGPVLLPNGNFWVNLNLGHNPEYDPFIGEMASFEPWRGWALEISPEGEMTPIAVGMRSPNGLTLNAEGDMFYSAQQGGWTGSGRITHIERGDFLGHPAGLAWADDPQSPIRLQPEDIPDTGRPIHEVAQEVPQLKVPTVWLPHGLMGISTSDIIVDTTGGGFGPFENQLFVGDQGASRINRIFLEKVDGAYQGAAIPFREGFMSGVNRMEWGKDGSMFVGMTDRGWAAKGTAPYGLQRLVWTGEMPMEMKEIRAQSDGFEIVFTRPVDRAVAGDPASYTVTSFAYRYDHEYGSPVINTEDNPVERVHMSEDGRSVRLAVNNLRRGYIHELNLTDDYASEDGTPLLHDVAYYTLNNIPSGPALTRGRRAQLETEEPEAASSTSGSSPAGQPKHQATRPAAWDGGPDETIVVGTEPGMKYDLSEFQVPAGSRVKLVFENTDDLLHNLVITAPGTADQVAEEALQLGLAGQKKGYVPESEDVLFHTSLLQPDAEETIYFRAPSSAGAYPFVCTFPGHAESMNGVMVVTE